MTEENEPVHVPVLADEIVELFGRALEATPGGLVVDATTGAGGHTALLLEQFPGIRVLACDQDPEILAIAAERLTEYEPRVELHKCRITDLSRLLRKLQLPAPAAILMDLGVSSLQLDRPARGFSFQSDGPLDMRMDPDRERTAADIVNTWDEVDLADLFFHEGGERGSRRIASAIVAARRQSPFLRTGALADLIARTVGSAGGGRIHPATKVFQALRRAVNEEGEELRAGLETAELALADGGLLAVISFHSGEDGVVKRFLAEGGRSGRWEVLTKKPIRPDHSELRVNSRSRSSRLRAALRRIGETEPGQDQPAEERPS
jgi:16S rRNA (cytosine1402-N4)-methyltransferase